MNEFQWLQHLRRLRQPRQPQRDLWASIEASLVEQAQTLRVADWREPRRRRHWWAAAIAASLLLAGIASWQLPVRTPVSTYASSVRWKPADPRLAGAAIELQAARLELEQALSQAPDSPALRRLLQRTRRQQAQLQQLAHDAS